MVLQTAADRILFLIWLQSLCLNVTHLVSFFFLLPESLISAQTGGSLLAFLQEGYVSSLSILEQENRQLRQALSEVHACFGFSNQDNYERALLNQAIPAQPQPAQAR